MSLEYRVGDVRERLAEIPDQSIDLIVTSPPFLALRSYLPADHPDKGKEIGSEATPAAFIDTLLALTAEFGRVLAPHGSLCVELGDTFSGSSQGGGDLIPGSGGIQHVKKLSDTNGHTNMTPRSGSGWPLAKSLTGIPTLYPWSLAYGRNLLTGAESPAGRWRIRNIIVWARPNPPVGALGDKFRPATSYITIACRSPKRFFDLDAVRTPHGPPGGSATPGVRKDTGSRNDDDSEHISNGHEAGAPPLDWHTDNHPQDGDWLWKLSTQPYAGSHYATFPLELPTRLIRAMCPRYVCPTCGPIQSNNEADSLRRMSGSDHEPASEAVLFETMRFEGRTQEPNGGSDSQWTASPEPPIRLRGVAVGGSSDVESGGFGVRASSDNGGTPRPVADRGRSGPPQERDQGRQPHREPGTAHEEHTRPDEQGIPTQGLPVSPLWGTGDSVGTCPRCGSRDLRTGVVLDPFAGSGTTLEAAQNVGRHAIGIDLDPRNADLAQSRVGMFLEVTA